MLRELTTLFGPSTANWLLVAASGLVFLAAAAVLPGLLRRLRGKDGPPLL